MVDKKKLKRVIPNILTDGSVEEFENQYQMKRRRFNQMPQEKKNGFLARLQVTLQQLDDELMMDDLHYRTRRKR